MGVVGTTGPPALRVGNVSIKYSHLALVVLVVCTTSLVLAMRYSRQRPTPDGGRYLSSTAVLCSEVLKVVASLLLFHYEQVHPCVSLTSWV
jgi:UDP-sugar transporter A1/2/3